MRNEAKETVTLEGKGCGRVVGGGVGVENKQICLEKERHKPVCKLREKNRSKGRAQERACTFWSRGSEDSETREQTGTFPLKRKRDLLLPRGGMELRQVSAPPATTTKVDKLQSCIFKASENCGSKKD